MAGFTLIEVMLVVAIIAILGALAIPHYEGYVAGSRRTEGFSYLYGVHLAQLSYFTDHDRYATLAVDLLQYGMISITQIPKYYTGFLIGADDPQRGYWVAISGNIDRDPSEDWLVRLQGAPQSVLPTYTQDGVFIFFDDRLF